MADRRASLTEPRIEALMHEVDSKVTLGTLSAMRAREINDYYNQLGEGLGRRGARTGCGAPRDSSSGSTRCRSTARKAPTPTPRRPTPRPEPTAAETTA